MTNFKSRKKISQLLRTIYIYEYISAGVSSMSGQVEGFSKDAGETSVRGRGHCRETSETRRGYRTEKDLDGPRLP